MACRCSHSLGHPGIIGQAQGGINHQDRVEIGIFNHDIERLTVVLRRGPGDHVDWIGHRSCLRQKLAQPGLSCSRGYGNLEAGGC